MESGFVLFVSFVIYFGNLTKTVVLTNVSYQIRSQVPEDLPDLYKMVKVAFEVAQQSNGNEHEVVRKLSKSKKFIQSLSLVCLLEKDIVGQMMLTEVSIVDDRGYKQKSLELGPLSVNFLHRGLGIGSALIKEGIHRAKEMGYQSIFVHGDSDYFSRFGFQDASSMGFSPLSAAAPPLLILDLKSGV